MPTNRPSQYNRSSIVRNTPATVARQDEALRLRRTGLAYIEIARQLGYTPNGVPRPQSAAEAVRAAERREGLALANGAVAVVARASAVNLPTPLNRTFGVEIEFFGITQSVANNALRRAGLVSAIEVYNHDARPWWKVTTDASVTTTGTGIGRGLEVVSPILQGSTGFADLDKVIKALLNAGAKIDKSCGIHVHIGADGLNGGDIIRIVELYTLNGSHIDGVLSRSRHDTMWARKYNNASLQHIRRTLSGVSGERDLRQSLRGMERYHAVNLASYLRHGTVEFRQHQGSLNGEKVASWVKFVMSLVNTAKNMSDADVRDFGSLDTLLTTVGLDDTTKTYMNRRAASLAGSR